MRPPWAAAAEIDTDIFDHARTLGIQNYPFPCGRYGHASERSISGLLIGQI